MAALVEHIARASSSVVFTALSKSGARSVRTLEEVVEGMKTARVVYFGERHDQPQILKAQLCLLHGLAGQRQKMEGGGGLCVVMEMFNLKQQHLLDAYANSTISLEDLQSEYDQSSEGFDIQSHYGYILTLARELGVPVRAGFAPKEMARLAAKSTEEFIAAVVAEGWGRYPDYVDLNGPEAYFRMFRKMITGKESGPDDDRYRAFFPAQTAKDATMAYAIQQALRGGMGQVLAVAGSGHIDCRLGIPHRLQMLRSGTGQALCSSPRPGDTFLDAVVTCRAEGEDLPETNSVADYVLTYSVPSEPASDTSL